MGIADWLRLGIQSKDFCLLFGVTIWLLWKTRNEAIFEQKFVTSDQLRLRVLHWITGVRERMRADSQALSGSLRTREEVLASWRPAPEGWITINTDGSVVHDQHQAAAGGIFRDHSGRRLACFAVNLGHCTIMRAELRAASIGFRIAWELGYRKIHLQMDSLAAVEVIHADAGTDGRHCPLI
ncbi:Putative ribonuclease H protein At1g65750 [Linum perenne]